ncbi:MAG: transporter [Flavobacteriaceae bacterium]|nr:transporter [Flavobacteriaceae bacterium]
MEKIDSYIMNSFVKYFLSFFIIAFNTVNSQKLVLNLEECVLLAYQKNISIMQSELQLKNSNIDLSSAKANFFPNLNASVNHAWNYGLNQNITTGIFENITTQFSSMNVNFNVDIFKGFENIRRLHRANLSVIAQQYNIEKIKDDIGLLVANSYLQVMFNKEFFKVSKEQLDITRKELERAKILLDAGLIVKGDLIDIEASLANQEQNLVQAENTLRLVKINLAQLLRLTDYENFDTADEDLDLPFTEIFNETPKSIYTKALTERNEIKLSVANLEIAETDLLLSKSRLQPSLTAFYSYSSRISYSDRLIPSGEFETVPIGKLASNSEPVVSTIEKRNVVGPMSVIDQFKLNDGHNFGLQLSIPIFNRLVVRNNIKRSNIQLESFQNQHEQIKLDLENTIYQAYNDTKASYKLYQASKKTVSARKDAFQNAQKKFESGTINSFDYAQIKQRYDSSLSDQIRAKFDYIFKLKVLEFYFGLKITI